MYNYGEFIRGFTDYIILSILSESDSYGYQIRKTIIRDTDQEIDLTEATLYLTLKRLLQADMIVAYSGENEKGIKRIYYQLTDKGRDHLAQFRGDVSNILDKIEKLVLGDTYERKD